MGEKRPLGVIEERGLMLSKKQNYVPPIFTAGWIEGWKRTFNTLINNPDQSSKKTFNRQLQMRTMKKENLKF